MCESIKILPLVECHEVFQPNHTLLVRVTLRNHLLDFSCCHLLIQLLCSSQQILLRDESLVILIEVLEDSLDVLNGIGLAGMLGHQLHEFLEGYLTSIVSIED